MFLINTTFCFISVRNKYFCANSTARRCILCPSLQTGSAKCTWKIPCADSKIFFLGLRWVSAPGFSLIALTVMELWCQKWFFFYLFASSDSKLKMATPKWIGILPDPRQVAIASFHSKQCYGIRLGGYIIFPGLHRFCQPSQFAILEELSVVHSFS